MAGALELVALLLKDSRDLRHPHEAGSTEPAVARHWPCLQKDVGWLGVGDSEFLYSKRHLGTLGNEGHLISRVVWRLPATWQDLKRQRSCT